MDLAFWFVIGVCCGSVGTGVLLILLDVGSVFSRPPG